jgi:alpha-glucuronidase
MRKIVLGAFLATSLAGTAQTADQAWLRYRSVARPPGFPTRVIEFGADPVERSAASELVRGLRGMLGRGEETSKVDSSGAVVIGTYQELRKRFPWWNPYGQGNAKTLVIHDEFGNQAPLAVALRFLSGGERFSVTRPSQLGSGSVLIEAPSELGLLYGVFALLRALASGEGLPVDGIHGQPELSIRWVDEWDNPDGSIERGYAGRSIFFEGGNVRGDLAPVAEYARLLASVGINGCNINNVNAAPQLLESDNLKQLARIADAMRPWGVRLAMSVDIASPQKIGGLATFDPLDPAVRAWWAAKVGEIYTLIPDFAGFTVKADSEGQAGPASYGRTPADAANLLAGALEPHGGVVLYRAFVYNHHADWRDPKADRARAAYDIFHPLDGKFAPNVIVQTKEGPIDFQAREPVSPLFAGLEKTSQAMEVQITQEYTGQQRHLVYLAPMWKQVLDFDLRADGRSTPVGAIIAGRSFHRPLGGMIGVAGVGRDAWLGSPLAMANLYAFGRLAWDPILSPVEIANEWARQTVGTDPDVVSTVVRMLMQSWPAYEGYTGPLGMQTLTDITGSHYGPNIESSENNGWGQWHRADKDGVGMDRTVATGTGYAGQYPPQVAAVYESLATCPDELLLFFHHVPYTYRLHSGKTVIQHIYDSHYDGAAQAAELLREWQTLEGRIDHALYEAMSDRLTYQAGHAIVWRDAIVQYFLKLSGIPDEKGRAGHYPGRMEAEDARLNGYKVVDVTPWEDASGGKAVTCPEKDCTAEWTYTGDSGLHDIAIQYFDLDHGSATFLLLTHGSTIAKWQGDQHLPSSHLNGDNSTRQVIRNLFLQKGDTIGVRGLTDSADRAALDYIEIEPPTPKLEVNDLPCADGKPEQSPNGKDEVSVDTIGPEITGWAGYTNVGDPAEGMKIEIFKAGATAAVAKTFTNIDGQFRFPPLPDGKYQLHATEKGVSTVDAMLQLSARARAQECLVVEAVDDSAEPKN